MSHIPVKTEIHLNGKRVTTISGYAMDAISAVYVGKYESTLETIEAMERQLDSEGYGFDEYIKIIPNGDWVLS